MKRLNRIIKSDGKTVIVALDHGQSLSVNPALNSTGAVLEKIIGAGADAVLVTYGTACRYAGIMRDVGLIVRIDGGGTSLAVKDAHYRLQYTVEDALRIGADAVVCMGFPGTAFEAESMENIALAVADGRKWGVPVVAEMLPGAFGPEPPKNADNLILSARIGCEYGSSIIKTNYIGPKEDFKKVVDASFAPVIILGGEKTKDLPSLFACIEDAMSVGAAGVAIGRNVWNHPEPDKVVAALVDLVHNGKRALDIVEF